MWTVRPHLFLFKFLFFILGGKKMKVFSFDAETNGLWGEAFWIGAIVTDPENETKTFLGHCLCPNPEKWVKNVILPVLEKDKESVFYLNQEELLREFSRFYLKHKKGAHVIVHMGCPVETSLLKSLHSLGFIGDWDGPYPLIDVSAALLLKGENPTSVDQYILKYQLNVGMDINVHNPLYDSKACEVVFRHLMG